MMFNLIKNLFKKPEPVAENKLTEKEMATARKEPYIRVVDTQFDPKNPANGYFELDWNSIFIDELKKAGYNGANEEEIVDKWFKAICQNVVSESNSNQEVRIV
jgi:hypothetical protein